MLIANLYELLEADEVSCDTYICIYLYGTYRDDMIDIFVFIYTLYMLKSNRPCTPYGRKVCVTALIATCMQGCVGRRGVDDRGYTGVRRSLHISGSVSGTASAPGSYELMLSIIVNE